MLKTGHYRSATHVEGETFNIEQALGSCSDSYPSDSHPVFDYADGLLCVVVSHTYKNGCQQVHLAVFEEGAGAAIIESLEEVTVDEEPAPRAAEFIRSQVFLICSGCDVIFTTHNAPLRDTRISLLINNLIRSFGGFSDSPRFLLQAALDEEKYREIMDQGIGEIDLGIAGFKQTLEHAIQHGHVGQSGLSGVLSSLWRRDLTEDDRIAAAKVSGRFVLRPGHDWDDAGVKAIMTEMAMELLDENYPDGFAIVTKNGLRVTQDAVRLSENFGVEGNRQVLHRQQTFDGLHQAFGKFSELGVIGDVEMVIDNDAG
jgi:hypothetical protein